MEGNANAHILKKNMEFL